MLNSNLPVQWLHVNKVKEDLPDFKDMEQDYFIT